MLYIIVVSKMYCIYIVTKISYEGELVLFRIVLHIMEQEIKFYLIVVY